MSCVLLLILTIVYNSSLFYSTDPRIMACWHVTLYTPAYFSVVDVLISQGESLCVVCVNSLSLDVVCYMQRCDSGNLILNGWSFISKFIYWNDLESDMIGCVSEILLERILSIIIYPSSINSSDKSQFQ